jgi:sortase A
MALWRVIGAVGRTLVTLGVLVLLFVAYQLWGTGVQAARAQADLRSEFLESLATTTTTAPATTTAPPATEAAPEPDPAPTTTAPPPPTTAAPAPVAAPARPPPGGAVALLRIPRIGVEQVVVEGVSVGQLKRGPGHYPGTPLPGEAGNSAVAGHRTTYGSPFYHLDRLRSGDEILVTTRAGEHRYVVSRTTVVRPDQVEVLDQTGDARLTLTTCHPRFSASQRLVVVARLVGEAPPPPPAEGPEPAEGEPQPVDEEPGTAEEEAEPDREEAPPAGTEDDPVVSGQVIGADAAAGLSGDPTARVPALLWGLAGALVWLATWAAGRRWRRWAAYLLAAPFLVVALVGFFEHLARLFPANI